MSYIITNFKIFESSLNTRTEFSDKDIQEIMESYLETALWTEEELDGRTIFEVDEKSKEKAIEDIKVFLEKAKPYILHLTNSAIGHNFWLNRNGHGAGFWDLKELDNEEGEIVSKICKEFKGVNVFDNGDTIIIE